MGEEGLIGLVFSLIAYKPQPCSGLFNNGVEGLIADGGFPMVTGGGNDVDPSLAGFLRDGVSLCIHKTDWAQKAGFLFIFAVLGCPEDLMYFSIPK